MSSIMRCRSGLMALSVMGDAPVLSEGCEPLISKQDALWRYPICRAANRGALPRERFSPMARSGHSGEVVPHAPHGDHLPSGRCFQAKPAFPKVVTACFT